MNLNDILTKVKKRKKALDSNSHLMNILMLILPSFLVAIIFGVVAGLALYSRFFSISLLSFVVLVLPMFYTVEKRLRASIYGAGKKDFNFIEGYKTFFSNRQSGIFGVFTSLTTSIMIAAVFYLMFFRFFSVFCSPFAGASDALETIANLETNNFEAIQANLVYLIKPGIVIASTIFFLPLLYLIFYSLNSNLSDHYLATVVLPDIDLNLSAAQARSLSKVSFKRYLNGTLFKLRFKMNYPIYIIFVALYVGSTFLFISFDYSTNTNIFFSCLCIVLVPLTALIYGLVLNYECLINEYILADELSPSLHEILPKAIKESVKATYRNPGYIHGDESLLKGSFFVEDNYVFDSNKDNTFNKDASGVETYTAYNADSEEVKGGVLDFTGNNIKKAEDNKTKKEDKEVKKENKEAKPKVVKEKTTTSTKKTTTKK